MCFYLLNQFSLPLNLYYLQTLSRAKNKAELLIESMDSFIMHWHHRMQFLNEKLRTAPGDALLTASSIVYLAVFDEDMRARLLNDWKSLLANRTVNVPFHDEFSLPGILSTQDEQMEWKRKGLSTDSFMLNNTLISRTCCIGGKKCWPLFIDPQNQAKYIVRCIEDGLRAATRETVSTGNAFYVLCLQNMTPELWLMASDV